MRIGHDQTVLPDHSLTPGGRTPTDSHILSDHGPISYDGHRLLTSKLQILRHTGDHCIGMDLTLTADPCAGSDDRSAVDVSPRTNLHIVLYDRKGIHTDILCKDSTVGDKCKRTDILI